MKLYCFALLIIVLGLVQANDDSLKQNEADILESHNRAKLRLPKLFDFNQFKQLFNKKYESFLEEMARKRIYLGRAFRAFISFVAYKHYKESSYLKIHENSDWTLEEMRSIEVRGAEESSFIEQDLEKEEPILPVADLGDIQVELDEIEQNQNEPGYREIANELIEKKFEPEEKNSRSSISMLEAVSNSLELKNESSSEMKLVDSNNEDYVAPTLNTLSADEQSEEVMDENKSSLINRLPGSRFLLEAVASVTNKLLGSGSSSEIRTESPKSKILIDHRGCLSEARNQGNCGSCYIFSTVALYEWLFCKEKNETIAFSEQYPLDCGDRSNMKGCGGGTETNVAEFVGKYGLELRRNYPYRKKVDYCPYEKFVGPRKMGYLKVNQVSLGRIKRELLEKYLEQVPVLIGIAVSDRFHDYGGGVDDGSVCDKRRAHSVLIVGSGEEDGTDYWLMRNSYGKSWGEKGYYKLSKKADCLLEAGTGFIVKKKNGEKIFGERNNFYDVEPIKTRYFAYKDGKNFTKPLAGATSSSSDQYAVTPPS